MNKAWISRVARRWARVVCGVAALFCFLIAFAGLLGGGVGDGGYYWNIHSKTLVIAEKVDDCRAQTGGFPDEKTIETWCDQIGLSPKLYLGAPLLHQNIQDDSGTVVPEDSYVLAYWDGDGFEFYYPWKHTFTTSIWRHSGGAALAGLLALGLGAALTLARSKLMQKSGDQNM